MFRLGYTYALLAKTLRHIFHNTLMSLTLGCVLNLRACFYSWMRPLPPKTEIAERTINLYPFK